MHSLKPAVHAILKELRDGERNEEYGICMNVFFELMKNNDTYKLQAEASKFLGELITKRYGEYKMFPIEGSHGAYLKNKNKWTQDTKHGAARLELLNYLIAETE